MTKEKKEEEVLKRKKRTARQAGMAALLVLCLCASWIFSTERAGATATEEDPWTPVIVFTEDLEIINANPGSVIYVKVPVKSLNMLIENPTVDVNVKDTPFLLDSKITLSKDNRTDPPKYIDADPTWVEFRLKVSEDAAEGTYKPTLVFQYISFNPNGMQDVHTYEMTTPIRIKVSGTSSKEDAALIISEMDFDKLELFPGDSFNISGFIKNEGEQTAKNIEVYVDGYENEGILPDYTNQKKKVQMLPVGNSLFINYPLRVSEKATPGMKTLTVHAIYDSNENGQISGTQGGSGMAAGGAADTAGDGRKEVTSTIYLEVKEKSKIENSSNLIIKNVSQSPGAPVANGRLAVTFTVENKGKVDAREVKVSVNGLTNTNFTPVKNEPYIYVKNIKAGAEKKITMNFIVADKVVEGLNEIGLGITYKDPDGQDYTIDGLKIYIRNVMNPEDAVVGVPKLIISDYSTGDKDIKAGKEFTLSFDIYNTHSTLSADNIKITLSSGEENTFSVVSGSNSFYINRIQPGETVHKEIDLKAKPDCVSKSYPLQVDFEYEYEGMQKLENEISTGLKINEKLNLQVFENARPTVSNIIVGTWDAPQMGMTCNMSFDFWNMGKSTLYNVMAKVEGDDFTPTQQTKFIGNVEAGKGETHEMELTPNVEGVDGKGVLVISYEDSNGNIYDVETDFSAFVNMAGGMDMGDMDMGMMEPEAEEKKDILPIWAFAILQGALFLAGIFLIKKITISIYKKRHMGSEDDI